MPKEFCVYILTNKNHTTLYTGMTSNLAKRIWEHKNNVIYGFTSKYQLHCLVYVETADSLEAALFREHQIKAGSRQKKIDLINKMNPDWKDLSDDICSLG
jgi:putative endonuclease